jgi:hypothetical protein
MFLLAAFEHLTMRILLLTPDMFPLIIDKGASVSLSPLKMHFKSPIYRVQNMTIKGIASRLTFEGTGDILYTYTNVDGKKQTVVLQDCMHIPQCILCLICLHQIGAETKHPNNGTSATYELSTLTINGKFQAYQYYSPRLA